MYIKECRICGKTFATQYVKKCLCSEECKVENNRRNSRKQNEKVREIKRTVKPMAKKKKPSVVDIAVRAREMGMTYGQYTAMLYMQEGRA